MSNAKAVNFTTPVGRLVFGSMSKPQTKDAEGKPYMDKKTGLPTQRFAFGVAIPKTPGVQHWANEPWGGPIWQVGHAAFPGGQGHRPDFAWKITDGDSAIPNKRGKRPCDQEGHPGHWVLKFSSSYAPRCYNSNGTAPVDADQIKTGYYVQVAGSVSGNGSDNQPGIYLNHSMVALAGYGEEIVSGPDPSQAGFGQGVSLPAGASATPLAGLPAPGVPTAAAPVAAAPAVPGVPAPAAAAPVVQTPVTPAPGFLAPAVTGAAPAPAPSAPVAPVAPVAAGPQMTAKANGTSYQSFIAAGWTDATLRQHGYMI